MTQLNFLEQLMQERRALSVSELTARLKTLVEGQFGDVWVEGEISNFRRHTSGHWYFTLKDDAAMLRCASFRMQNRLIRFTPEDGLTVRARGRLSLYEARGDYQLLVDLLEPVGVGALQFAFEQLKRKLSAQGLFDPARKRPLPLLPRRIGVVTSPDGAAVRDILRVIKRRNQAISIIIAPARVQGDGAAADIAQAIEALNSRSEVDVIIVGRGGGSTEDLSCFNEERVARAIHSSRTPVISAVGHETDFTIADFVADLRASTPSAAAEMVALARQEIWARISRLTTEMAGAFRYRLLRLRNNVSELESHRAFGAVEMQIKKASQRFDDGVFSIETALRRVIRKRRGQHNALALRLGDADIRRRMIQQRGKLAVLKARIRSSQRVWLDERKERLSVAAGKLDSLSPLSVLGRGYAIAFDSNGGVIKRAIDVNEGERVRVRLAEGDLHCIKAEPPEGIESP